MNAAQKRLILSVLFASLPAGAARGQAPAGWKLETGALMDVGGADWTGTPDGTPATELRLLSERADLGDAAVSFQLYNEGLVESPRLPAAPSDGVHVLLRRRDANNLYAVSVSRRDGTVRIQKKAAGRYFDLAQPASRPAAYGRWERVTVAARDSGDGSVSLQAYVGGTLALSAVDEGVGGPALTGPGAAGLRGDNCRFLLDDLAVTPLKSP